MGRRGEKEEEGREVGEVVAMARVVSRDGSLRRQEEGGRWWEKKVEGKKNRSGVVL